MNPFHFRNLQYRTPEPWLKMFEESVLDLLEAQADGILDRFCQIHYPGGAHKTNREELRDLNADSAWPRGTARLWKVAASSPEDEWVASARLDWIWWNPRDGESWTFSLGLKFPHPDQWVELTLQNNSNAAIFSVRLPDAEPLTCSRIKVVLDDYFGEQGVWV